MPAPPARDVDLEPETAATTGGGDARTPARPAPRPAAPAPPRTEPPRPETPAEPARPPDDATRPPATLQTAPATAENEQARAIRAMITRANGDLARVDYRRLNADARGQYDTAKRFIKQADDAVRAKNFVFANSLAEKAASIAAQLSGR
jgi:hypothetical protein